MKQIIKWIVDFIISFLKDMMSKTKIKKLEEEVKDASQKADEDVKRANKGYDDFMSDYNAYQSDLKRRGHVEVAKKQKKAIKSQKVVIKKQKELINEQKTYIVKKETDASFSKILNGILAIITILVML